jgi:hypothetical protein
MNKLFCLGFQQAKVNAGPCYKLQTTKFSRIKKCWVVDLYLYIYSKVSLFIIFLLKDGPSYNQKGLYDVKIFIFNTKKWAHELEKRRRFQ